MAAKAFQRWKRRAVRAADPGRLASDLWIDQPGAVAKIEARRKQGLLDRAQAERLRAFHTDGFARFPLHLGEKAFAAMDRAVERLWSEKPFQVAFSYRGPLQPMAQANEGRHRRPSYRLADLHSWDAAALGLYLHPQLCSFVEMAMGEPVVAIQSLYFEFGSQQHLHRDPLFVTTDPPSHLMAAWIALEEIDALSGPLLYVPGSHRLPFQVLPGALGSLDCPPGSDDEARAIAALELEACQRQGLEVKPLICRRGEAFIWHASLLHGGAVPRAAERTRKSFVVHFSTETRYHLRRTSFEACIGGPPGEVRRRSRVAETDRILELNGYRGFDNPLRRYRGHPLPRALEAPGGDPLLEGEATSASVSGTPPP